MMMKALGEKCTRVKKGGGVCSDSFPGLLDG
jgi:hypothetical protein